MIDERITQIKWDSFEGKTWEECIHTILAHCDNPSLTRVRKILFAVSGYDRSPNEISCEIDSVNSKRQDTRKANPTRSTDGRGAIYVDIWSFYMETHSEFIKYKRNLGVQQARELTEAFQRTYYNNGHLVWELRREMMGASNARHTSHEPNLNPDPNPNVVANIRAIYPEIAVSMVINAAIARHWATAKTL